jgi:hypothetical protein
MRLPQTASKHALLAIDIHLHIHALLAFDPQHQTSNTSSVGEELNVAICHLLPNAEGTDTNVLRTKFDITVPNSLDTGFVVAIELGCV